MTSSGYAVVGGGAIGGTLAFALARAGHRVTVIDSDTEHVRAIRQRGLTLERDGERQSVSVAASTPNEFDDPLDRVLLAVKAQATEPAARWIAARLTEHGYTASLQNGFNEAVLARHLGWERTVAAFVNLFADVVEPGVIRDGGAGALVVGEPGGGAVSDRVDRLATDLRAWGPARTSDNVEGFLWAKAGFGAMLAATALADDAMAVLIDRHRPAMHALGAEVFDVAEGLGTRLEGFDAFEPLAFTRHAEPAERLRATDRLTAWLRTQSKNRSGIWRDIAVRGRKVEVTTHYDTVLGEAERIGVATPVLRAMLDELGAVESDPSTMSESRLDTLDQLAAEHYGEPR